MRISKIIIPILSTILIAGCGGQTVEVSADIKSVINSYKEVPADIKTALATITRECMKDNGHSYSDGGEYLGYTPSQAVNGDATLHQQDNSYITTEKHEDLSSGQSQEYLKALTGSDSQNPDDHITYILTSGMAVAVGKNSCTAKAYEQVFGSVENGLKYTNFSNDLLTASNSSEANQEIGKLYKDNKEYPQCMNQAGYPDVKTFGDAPKVAEQKFGHYRAPGTQANAEERAMAQADYTCQESSGIVRKAEDIFYSKAAQWLKDHEALIMEIRDIEKAAKERAVQIINNQS